MATKKPWKKVLYLAQSYPDNYTDEKYFLSELTKNKNFKATTWAEAVIQTTCVTEEMCSVLIFITVYLYLVNQWAKPNEVLFCIGLSTLIGFIWYSCVFIEETKEKIGSHIRTALSFVVFGHLFSPILHTLTDSISTDTIYTMSFLMMNIHLIFFEYNITTAITSKSVSLSAAIFASICLASRVSSGYEAFILMTASTEMFVLFPIFRSKLKNYKYFTLLVLVLIVWTMPQISVYASLLIIVTLVFVNLLCPLLFVRYQIYKENIYGPWDEAVVNEQ